MILVILSGANKKLISHKKYAKEKPTWLRRFKLAVDCDFLTPLTCPKQNAEEHTQFHTHTHPHSQSHSHNACTHTGTHTHTGTFVHLLIHAYTHTRIITVIHAHTSTHTHVHKCTRTLTQKPIWTGSRGNE